MAKSGLKLIRRKPQKLPVHLRLEERYEVATYIINHENVRLKTIADHFNISESYVSNIRDEFLVKMWVWKPGVLKTLLEAQGELFEHSRTIRTRPKK